MERKYYLALPGGKSMEAINQWQKMNNEAWDALSALTEKYGAGKEVLQSGKNILAMCFKHDPGRGWCPEPYRKGCYKPHRGTKEGKEIARQMNAIKIPDSFTFAKLIGGGAFIVNGNRWGNISFEKVDDNFIVSVPVGSSDHHDNDGSFVPPDATRLKLSEYYALKEKLEAEREHCH